MGFDVSGVNPQINKSESEYKHYKEDTDIWKTDDEKLRWYIYCIEDICHKQIVG